MVQARAAFDAVPHIGFDPDPDPDSDFDLDILWTAIKVRSLLMRNAHGERPQGIKAINMGTF